MGSELKILDCTLRDGGYYTNWDFERSLVRKYVECITRLPVDIIEVGYRTPVLHGYAGEYFHLPRRTLQWLHAMTQGRPQLALMLNAKDFEGHEVVPTLSGCEDTVNLVRVAITPDNVRHAIDLAVEAKRAGFNVSVNLMYLNRLLQERSMLEDVCADLAEAGDAVDYVYFVDSYGACFPEQIRAVIGKAKERIPQRIGFHGHDNVSLAFANTLAAIEAGASLVDCTVLGMGRGAGNLRTELLMAYLAHMRGFSVDFTSSGELFEEFERMRDRYRWGTSIPYMISGLARLPQKDIMEWIVKKRYSTETIVRMLQGQRTEAASRASYANIRQWAQGGEGNCDTVVVIGGGRSAVRHKEAIGEYSTTVGATVVHSSLRNVEAYRDARVEQLVCLAGQEIHKIGSRGDELRQVSGFVVSSVGQVEQRFPPGLEQRIYSVGPLWTNDGDNDTPGDSPLALALAAAVSVGARRVLLAGFDGYPEEKGGVKALAQEVQLTINKFVREFASIELRSVTPTLYKVSQGSIYALLAREEKRMESGRTGDGAGAGRPR